MTGFFTTIIHWLTPDVIVDMSRNVVAFHCQGRVESFEPVLWIVGEERQQRLITVGGKPTLTQSAQRIELFGVDWNGKSEAERLDFLQVFFRYGLLKVVRRELFIRPGVLVRNLERMLELESGDSRVTITRALEMAGAHEVRWE